MTCFSYLGEISVGVAVLACLLIVVKNWWQSKPVPLEGLLISVFSASSIPTAITLVCAGFKPELLVQLKGFNVHIAIAGIVLGHMSFNHFFKNSCF